MAAERSVAQRDVAKASPSAAPNPVVTTGLLWVTQAESQPMKR